MRYKIVFGSTVCIAFELVVDHNIIDHTLTFDFLDRHFQCFNNSLIHLTFLNLPVLHKNYLLGIIITNNLPRIDLSIDIWEAQMAITSML